MFFSADATPENKEKYTIEISEKHPAFVNSSRHLWKILANQNEYSLVKITWNKSEEKKKLLERDDFIEIEELKNDTETKWQNNEDGWIGRILTPHWTWIVIIGALVFVAYKWIRKYRK